MKSSGRLRAVERRLDQQEATLPRFVLFYDHELIDCLEHSGCKVETETGEHHRGVFTLQFDSGPVPLGK